MNNTKRITVIPPISEQPCLLSTDAITRKRVAAYARVSTDSEEQLSSYEAQVNHYSNYIKEKEDWDFVEVYSDEGISATSTRKRDGFNRMITDAVSGNIDLIITKSVSRFARNTVDTLVTVRQLKEKGVEVFFEKENIYTMDSKGELLITIMSSLAQEESRSISENVTWGQRKRFADGKINLPYGQFLGYEKGADGLPKIVESEAVTVHLIYRLFLEGKSPTAVARCLSEKQIPTPSGKQTWQASTVLSILQNEKYAGNALLQKTYTVDFLTKKKKINEGEIQQYYVENSHPAIVPQETHNLVQYELKRRKNEKGYKTSASPFSGKIVCGECGSHYGSKVWHSTSKYRRTIWQCNNKFKNNETCSTPHLYENSLKKAFLGAFNSLLSNKGEIVRGYTAIIRTLTDTTSIDGEIRTCQDDYDGIMELLRRCVDENAHSAMDQAEYQKRYDGLIERYEAAKGKIAQLNETRTERAIKRENILKFLKVLARKDALITEFDEDLWNTTVDSMTVRSDGGFSLIFKDGMTVEWE